MSTRYTQEFREEAARLVVDGNESMRKVAEDLGINVWTLRDWVRARRRSAGVGKSRKVESMEEENRRLRRENSVLRQEREILKKAAAFFAREQQ